MATESESSDTSERSREELRQELIEAASGRLKGQSVQDFSTPKVAEDCDTSRMMIYTLFGGKSGLLKAVYDSKAKELGERFESVEAEDPIDFFYQMGIVYRDFMLDHAALYDTVFSLEAVENYERQDKLIERVDTFRHFEEVIEELIEAEVLPADTDVQKLTDELWSSMNGIITMTVLDFYPDEETALEHYVDTAFAILAGQSSKEDFLAKL